MALNPNKYNGKVGKNAKDGWGFTPVAPAEVFGAPSEKTQKGVHRVIKASKKGGK